MSNNDVPFEVIVIDDSPHLNTGKMPPFKKGDILAVIEVHRSGDRGIGYFIQGDLPRNRTWCSFRFRRVAKSFTNALTASLASQVEVGDGVDVKPVKIEI